MKLSESGFELYPPKPSDVPWLESSPEQRSKYLGIHFWRWYLDERYLKSKEIDLENLPAGYELPSGNKVRKTVHGSSGISSPEFLENERQPHNSPPDSLLRGSKQFFRLSKKTLTLSLTNRSN